MPSAKHIAVLFVLFLASPLHAAVPDTVSYQGYLTDPAGAAVDDSLSITFLLYSVPVGGSPLWSDTRVVAIESGLFSVDLGGSAAPFPAGLFDTPLWIGLSVGGDAEMSPRRPLTSAAFSFKADDALSLQGQGPAAFDQSAHVAATDNPHAVTAVQAGAATSAELAGVQSDIDASLSSIIVELANDTDGDPANEIQNLGRNGSDITITGGSSASVNDADADPLNELQTISLSENQLSISDGNSVTLANVSIVKTMVVSTPGQTTSSVLLANAGGSTAEVMDQCWTPPHTAGSGEQAIIHASMFFDAGSVTLAAPLAGWTDNDLTTVHGNGNGVYQTARYFSPTVFGIHPLNQGTTYRFGMIVSDGPTGFSGSCQTLVQIVR